MMELESQKAKPVPADDGDPKAFLEGRSHTNVIVFDGDEPGQVGLYVEHNRTDDDTGIPGLHYVCGIAIARLWDAGVLQALTAPMCPDLIKKDGVDGNDEAV